MSDNANVWWLIGLLVLGAAAGALSYTGPRVPDAVVPPIVDAGPDMGVPSGGHGRLTATARDPRGGELTFLWTADGDRGVFDDPTQLRPVYTAPLACGEEEHVVLILTVTNAYGLQAVDRLTIIVCDPVCHRRAVSSLASIPSPFGLTTVPPPSLCAPLQEVCPPADAPCAPLPDPCAPTLGPGEPEPGPCAVNRPPTADAGEDITVPEGARVRLTCGASDPDGDPLTFLWQAAAGAFDDPTVLHPNYTAPRLDGCAPVPIPVTLTVTDPSGATACDALVVCVTPVNRPPSADAGEDITVPEGARVRLTCGASDPDGDPLTFLWQAAAGAFDDPTVLHPNYTAPRLDGCAPVPIHVTLTVTDPSGASACDALVVCVTPVNRPPTADAGEDITLPEGTRVRLTCGASDPDGDPLTFLWQAAAGAFDDPTVLHPNYTAPRLDGCAPVPIPVTLTVTDPSGASACDALVVCVTPVNRPPYVQLGEDVVLVSGASFRLLVSAGDPDGDWIQFRWSVPEGQGWLDGATARAPAYRAPMVSPGREMMATITVVVTDAQGAQATDTLRVRVRNPAVAEGPQ